jgi:hypothetical protein
MSYQVSVWCAENVISKTNKKKNSKRHGSTACLVSKKLEFKSQYQKNNTHTQKKKKNSGAILE